MRIAQLLPVGRPVAVAVQLAQLLGPLVLCGPKVGAEHIAAKPTEQIVDVVPWIWADVADRVPRQRAGATEVVPVRDQIHVLRVAEDGRLRQNGQHDMRNGVQVRDTGGDRRPRPAQTDRQTEKRGAYS